MCSPLSLPACLIYYQTQNKQILESLSCAQLQFVASFLYLSPFFLVLKRYWGSKTKSKAHNFTTLLCQIVTKGDFSE